MQAKIDELKVSYQVVEKKVKECHDLMNRAGIRNISIDQSASPSTIEIPKEKSPQELKMLIAQMESRLESLTAERDIILSKTKAVEEAIRSKHLQLQQAIDDNIDREQRYIAIRSRDPVELQSEIRQVKAREIDLANRIRSLKALPMYDKDSNSNTLFRLNVRPFYSRKQRG